jgi:predicted  nucleic acid-binding Zn-ribbon protein
MTGFFDKLNTLIRSRMNDLTSPSRSSSSSSPTGPDPRTVETLRERINEAIARENELRERVAGYEDEIARLDAQADEAVQAGNDAQARHLVAQMQRAQQRLTMAQTDLNTHQRVAEELILEVNQLEAALADQQRADTDDTTSPTTRFDAVMKKTQETISSLGDKISTQRDRLDAEINEDTTPEDDSRVEDDLEARRNRLMKK